MPKRNSRAADIRKAAVMACMGATQEDIGKQLGLRQSAVSKLLSQAREDGLVLDRPPAYGGPEAEFEELARQFWFLSKEKNGKNIFELLNDFAVFEQRADVDLWPGFRALRSPEEALPLPSMPKIHAYFAGHETGSQPGWSQAVRNWANGGVAGAVHTLLTTGDYSTPSRFVGVGWGRQIRAVCDGIKALQRAKADDPINFVPLMGTRNQMVWEQNDTVFTNPYAVSSNELALDFHRAVNGDHATRDSLDYYLPGIDFIPFDDANADGFHFDVELSADGLENERAYLSQVNHRFFGAFEAYRKTFGPPDAARQGTPARCDLLDSMIVALGSSTASLLIGTKARYGGISQEWFEEHSIGDIGCVLLFRKTTREQERRRIEQQIARVRLRWMGVQEHHIRRCADRARSAGTIGVVVLAVGKSRGEVVLECLRRGLVNHLFVDFSLMDELIRLLRDSIPNTQMCFPTL